MTTMTKSEFARHINVTPGYVTQMNASGRLVMEGNKVNVEESIKRIEDTRDPSKSGVADRHSKNRENKDNPKVDSDSENKTFSESSAYHEHKTIKEKYNALQAKIAYEKELKQLLPADDVRQAVMDGDTIIRSRIESLPDMLAPQLAAELDEQRVRAILTEQIELLLMDLSSSFNKLAAQ